PRSAAELRPPALARCLEDAEEERREDHFDAKSEQGPAHDGEVGDGLVELAAVRADPEPEDPRIDAEADEDRRSAHQERELEPVSGEKPLDARATADAVEHEDRLREHAQDRDLQAEDGENAAQQGEVR